MRQSGQTIPCQSLIDIPSVAEIKRSVTKERPLELQFPFPSGDVRYAELTDILRDVSTQLPNHRIFNSGGPQGTTHITILKVVDEHVILDHVEVFLQAVERYVTLENELVTQLARQLNVSPDQIDTTWGEKIDDAHHHGRLGEEWDYCFHGFECWFRHTVTGQIVDASLRDYGKKDVIPDPGFLAEYLETTSTEYELSAWVDFNFHDIGQMLRVLVHYGYLPQTSS